MKKERRAWSRRFFMRHWKAASFAVFCTRHICPVIVFSLAAGSVPRRGLRENSRPGAQFRLGLRAGQGECLLIAR